MIGMIQCSKCHTGAQGYNPVNATTQGMISVAIVVNTDTSNHLINVSNMTRFTRLQSCD